MANLTARTRTNYFYVHDPEKFKNIVSRLATDDGDEAQVITHEDEELNCTLYGFSMHGECIGYVTEDGTPEYDLFLSDMQDILPEGNACIIMTTGYEKMRYFVNTADIITKDDFRQISLDDLALKSARKMLKNPEYTTELSY